MMKKKLTHLLGISLYAHIVFAWGMIDPIQDAADQQIKTLYAHPQWKKRHDRIARLNWISQMFLNKPYVFTPLGDGMETAYDQFPEYRLDRFNCETYVDTMMALALSHNHQQFKQINRALRYHHQTPYFLDRNLFSDIDWNKNNAHKGYIEDVTTQITDSQGHPLYQMAHTRIDRLGWLNTLKPRSIRLRHHSTRHEIEQRLAHLKQQGQHLKAQESYLPYLPIERIDAGVLAQIPNGAIIEIVRPNWDLRKHIGTHVNVSHMGFAFWKQGVLFFREASSLQHRVVDTELLAYLRVERMHHPTIKGINIQKIRPSPSDASIPTSVTALDHKI